MKKMFLVVAIISIVGFNTGITAYAKSPNLSIDKHPSPMNSDLREVGSDDDADYDDLDDRSPCHDPSPTSNDDSSEQSPQASKETDDGDIPSPKRFVSKCTDGEVTIYFDELGQGTIMSNQEDEETAPRYYTNQFGVYRYRKNPVRGCPDTVCIAGAPKPIDPNDNVPAETQ